MTDKKPILFELLEELRKEAEEELKEEKKMKKKYSCAICGRKINHRGQCLKCNLKIKEIAKRYDKEAIELALKILKLIEKKK